MKAPDTHRLSSAVWIALALTIASASPVRAQYDRRVDAAVGYSSMRDYDGGATFPRGWFASLGADLGGPVAVLGDVSGSYKSIGGLNAHAAVRIHTFMGGPRVQWRRRVSPYAQMLFGVARTGTTFKLPEETLSDARNSFAMAPGAGLDIQLTDRAAVRAGTSVRFIRSEVATPTGSESFVFRELQVIAGVVIR